MDVNKPLGMSQTCRECGGKNAWTGRERRTPWTEPAFGRSARTRIVSAEIRCAGCGRTEWPETGIEKEGEAGK